MKPSPLSTHAAPPPNTPDEPVAALPASESVYPVQLFAPFTEWFAGGARDIFDGHTFQVSFAAEQKGIEVSSCDALLALPLTDEPRIWLEPPTENELQVFWSTAVDCLALRLVRDAQPAQRSRMAQLLSSADPARLLPPQLGMVDFDDNRKGARAAAAQCKPWKNYDRRVRTTKKGPERFAIRAEDWTGDLEVYARGDIDGDGDEDVLVRRNGHVDGGTYYGAALFLLSQTERDPCIRVVREFGSS